MANWMVGLGGLDWIDQLIESGDAASLGGSSGYPSRFTVTACAALPLILKDPPPPGVPLPDGHGPTRGAYINRALLAQCAPDEQLLVEAWDQS
ncbi:hypothetical protein [Mycolicibacterium mengxianglii]|uniref:hypothetical protein n=1 Tax=Mycolicibacterium mengxianglii TaxID=2736649 RepID=UPI0018D1F333|nr:hypothetical protein [Mycolicibacterium mengxianglii]